VYKTCLLKHWDVSLQLEFRFKDKFISVDVFKSRYYK